MTFNRGFFLNINYSLKNAIYDVLLSSKIVQKKKETKIMALVLNVIVV